MRPHKKLSSHYQRAVLKILQKMWCTVYSVGVPVRSGDPTVLKNDLSRVLTVPAHLLLVLSEAQARCTFLHHDAADGLAGAAYHDVQIGDTCVWRRAVK